MSGSVSVSHLAKAGPVPAATLAEAQVQVRQGLARAMRETGSRCELYRSLY